MRRHGTWPISPIYRGAVVALWPTLKLVTKRDWRGTANLRRFYPPDDGVVIAANHLSWVDPLTLSHVLWDNGRSPRFLAKDALFHARGVGVVLRGANQIPVMRETESAAAAVNAAVHAVRDGESVVMYPEGTITRDEHLWPMTGRTGAARIALMADAPVIPIAQWGPQDIMRPYHKELHLWPRKTIHANVGAPVDLDDLRGEDITGEVLTEATDRIIGDITRLLEELRGRTAPKTRLNYRAWRTAQEDDK